MTTVNVHAAKSQLSDLLARAERGEDIVIARSGTPVARLVPVDPAPPRIFGSMDFEVPEDFDAPLAEDELGLWE